MGKSLYQVSVLSYLRVAGKAAFSLHGPESDLVLITLILNSFVFCQCLNEIRSWEMEKIGVLKGKSENYVFVVVLGCTVVFQIIIIEFLGTANTSPLTFTQWFFSVFIGLL
ncbi:hypothetical protein C5167_011154 [Papaver somniferum]|uniref:Cation-transporting P-type ATPase C-terminal domain-containing protein n=1 Tax=Papaver somniferum TaxID=3469 RepID=A0A4Y7K545_PAPSO|nr:hypothetical protein C5167_011154 [Papaver somniferum]